MKKGKRFFALLLTACMALSVFSGCGKQKQPLDDTNSAAQKPPQYDGITKEPADGIGEPGKDFVLLETGASDDWGDVPAPFFNPLGSYALYSSVISPRESGGENNIMLYTLDGYTEKKERKEGDLWVLSIENPDYSLYWLRWYVREAGGQWFPGTRDHSTFCIPESESVSWWADARQTENGVEIWIVKTNILPIGKPVTIRPAEFEDGFILYSPPTNGKLQSATVTLGGVSVAGVEITITSEEQLGRYCYETMLLCEAEDINLKKTNRFVLDDLPIAQGELCWKLEWSANYPAPDDITLTLDTIADIPTVNWGEAPGAIRVVGAPAGITTVSTSPWATIEHSEVTTAQEKLLGFTQQNGDLFFPAPAGYYQVTAPAGAPGSDSCLRLVPVNAGEITTVTIPPETNIASGAMSRLFGSFEENTGGIELLDNVASGDTATATFVLNDPLERDVFPAKENIKIAENGISAVVTDIKRQPAASNVVLVLDSSGSMGENMKPCLEAAKTFVQSLPENTSIQLIQFAQIITNHKGNDKPAVLKALDSIKEGGATSLYDATAQGLDLLEGKERGYIVVFSDGADSREPGIDGQGSTLSKEDLLERIAAGSASVLTIGFGSGHDPSTLVAMSAASSNGGYFAAADQAALKGAFGSVAGKFGNQFTVTYQRPIIPTDKNSTVPVVSFMIDTSGSMDMEPSESGDTGWRMDRMKAIFHDFILKLPSGTLMQLGSFATPEIGGISPGYQQITTDQKGPVLQALGYLYGSGGTPTNEALNLAYYNLSSVPSQKRVLVFFTDLALYDPSFPEEHDAVFTKLKESGIQVLFAGLADGAYHTELETIFKTSAEKTGGDYILTDSPEEIGKKLDELLSKLGTPTPKKGVDFTLGVDCTTDDGGRMNFYTSVSLPNFTPKTGPGKQIDPQMVKVSTGEKYTVYNSDAAQLLYGGDQPVTQSNILLRVPFTNKQDNNKFAKLSVSEAYLMDVFKGIPAPSGQIYLALNITLDFAKENKAAKEIGYNIPSIFNHIYVSLNEGRMMPPSQATWLAEKSFVNPGEPDVSVFEKESRSGALIFLVDQPYYDNISRLSLHLYDTTNGHIELPLAGRLTKQMVKMEAMPTQAPQEMSKAFALSLTGKTDLTQLEGVTLEQLDPEYSPQEAGQNANFRVLEANFDSRVQALLDIDPTQRFFYRLKTNHGELLVPMSNIVRNLPLGFVGSTMLAPGSCSKVRMPFVLPNELLKNQADIYADLATGSVDWNVVSGQPYETVSDGKTYSHQYFDFTINSLAVAKEGSNNVVLDFTLHDKKDGDGTGGIESILQLERGEQDESEPSALAVGGRSGLAGFSGGDSKIATVDAFETNKLIFGALQENGTWGAFDGQSRRGILIFTLGEGDPTEWSLTSSMFPNLKVPVSAVPYAHIPLLAPKPDIAVDDTFEKALEEAVSGAIATYNATRPEPRGLTPVGLSDEEVLGKQVPSPSLTLYGEQQLKVVRSDAEFLALMRRQKWIPSDIESIDYAQYRYAPQAVITQGWGGQHDLAVLSKTLLARLGYKPEYRMVAMTETGIQNLQNICGLESVPKKIIGISYTDASGTQKLFLPIFNADLSDLLGLGYLTINDTTVEIVPMLGRITIELYGKVIGNAGSLMQANSDLWGSLGAAMEGDEYESGYYETVPLLDREVSLPDMSLDAIDISYLAKPKSDGSSLLLPVLDTRQGLIYDPNTWVDSSYYEFKRLNIKLNDGQKTSVHTTMLNPGQKINEIFQTLAWGVPELTAESASSINAMAKTEAEAAIDPANYSVCRWLGHATISRLVMGLSEASRTYASTLEIIAGRSDQAIALLATTKSDGKTAETSVDLVNHRNQLHSGDDSVKQAYNLLYGYYASDMEAAALPGGVGYGYTQVWNNLPNGTVIDEVEIENIDSVETAISNLGKDNYPALLWERMRGDVDGTPPHMLYLIPNKPSIIEGKSRWAWLEIDLTTYDVVSVFDTGERAGMGEYLIGCFPGNGNYGEVGAGMLVGVTTAVGSVTAYSLNGDDFKTVLKLAEAKCTEIGKHLANVSDVTGRIDAGGKFKEGLSGEYDWDEWVPIKWEKLFEGGESLFVNKLTFQDGYNYAVEAYFKRYKS